MTENSTRKRVKVYKLNDDGEWDDAGTGHVSCLHHEVQQPFHLKPIYFILLFLYFAKIKLFCLILRSFPFLL